MAVALGNRLGPGGLLFAVPLLALAIHYGIEAGQADACLDQGGSYDYETQTCSLTEAFPASSYLDRHWPKVVLASLLASAGLVLLGRALWRRRE